MDLKSGYPYWAVKNGLMKPFPRLEADHRCDVAIVGGAEGRICMANQFLSVAGDSLEPVTDQLAEIEVVGRRRRTDRGGNRLRHREGEANVFHRLCPASAARRSYSDCALTCGADATAAAGVPSARGARRR